MKQQALLRTAVITALVSTLSAAGTATAESYEGVLETSDSVTPERNAYYDDYTFELQTGQLARVQMNSNVFDTYLIVQSPSGFLYENDDFQGTSMSRIDFIAEEGGTWTIQATAYSSEMVGPYTVELTPGAVAEIRTWEGRLDPRDDQSLKGEYVDEHAVELEEMVPFRVELLSYGFDGFLVVESPAGRFWRNDDAGSLDKSSIGPLTPASGTWTFHVTSAAPGEVGAYDLRVVYLPQ